MCEHPAQVLSPPFKSVWLWLERCIVDHPVWVSPCVLKHFYFSHWDLRQCSFLFQLNSLFLFLLFDILTSSVFFYRQPLTYHWISGHVHTRLNFEKPPLLPNLSILPYQAGVYYIWKWMLKKKKIYRLDKPDPASFSFLNNDAFMHRQDRVLCSSN